MPKNWRNTSSTYREIHHVYEGKKQNITVERREQRRAKRRSAIVRIFWTTDAEELEINEKWKILTDAKSNGS